jgi:hypothetical protein
MVTSLSKPKILFVGWGRSGKDEAAHYLSTITKLRYAGSFSWAALPYMAKLLDQHPQVAWENRHRNRALWKRELDKLREKDQCYLARLVLKQGELAAGLRDQLEIDAVKREKLFDYIVWIDRAGTEPDPTVTFTAKDCDLTINNAGSLEEFRTELRSFAAVYLPLK